MGYADAHTQAQLDQLQRAAGRPLDSPGWGKLVAVKSGAYVSERNPADRTTIEAGSTHVCRDYWLARERPELFKPADKRDARTYREHRAHLERARQELRTRHADTYRHPNRGAANT
jgi:Zn-finger nucleic acid-binding protein